MSEIQKHRKPLRLGMAVQTLDGEAGKITKIITDLARRRPEYFVVRIGKFRRRREVVVPVSLVTAANVESVSLNVRREALADFPLYEVTVQERRYEKPFPVGRMPKEIYTPASNRAYVLVRQRSVPERSIAVEKGMLIQDRDDQRVGNVEGVVMDVDEREAKYLVFRRDHFTPPQLVPTVLVEDVTSTAVKLRIDWKLAEKLPFLSENTERKLSLRS